MSTTVEQLVRQRFPARNFPRTPVSVEDVRQAGLTLDDLWLPTVVARSSAIDHNLARFASWCRERSVDHAPHGKTSMSPQLWQRQLEQGAWGITAATVAQARIMHDFGVERVILANEVVDPNQAEWLARVALEQDRTYPVLVDSEAGVRVLEEAASAAGSRVPVLVEIGVAGRRTGVRTVTEGLELARRVHRSKGVVLAGIEGYEGVLPQGRDGDAVAAVAAWLRQLTDLAARADAEGLFDRVEEIVVTAGGSAFPDLATDALNDVRDLSRPVRRIVRSGCVVTHDHQSYERSSPLRSSATPDPLVPALTARARVMSTPEPGRALATVGKRDIPVDVDLPLLLRVRRSDSQWHRVESLMVVELNDHHLFIDDPDSSLELGNVVELGLSHPCTTFDKWDLIPLVDEDDRVTDAIATLF